MEKGQSVFDTIPEPVDEKPLSSQNNKLRVLVFLSVCQILSVVGILLPYLLEIQKPKEESHSTSLFVWFLLYNFAAVGLGDHYGRTRIMSGGFVLAAIWAAAECGEAKGTNTLSGIVSSTLRTVGPSIAFPNVKLTLDPILQEVVGTYYWMVVAIAGVGAAVGFNKVNQSPWIIALYGSLCVLVSVVLFLFVPNKPRGVQLKWPVNLLRVVGLVVNQILWERLSEEVVFTVKFVVQASVIVAGACGSLWLALP